MTSKACTPDNVIGKMLGMREYKNLPVGMDTLSELDHGGKASYQNLVDQHKEEIFDYSTPTDHLQDAKSEADNKVVSALTGDGLQVTKSVLADVRNPSGILGEDIVAPISDFITNHHEQHFNDLQAGRSEYMRGIKEVFDNLDISDLNDPQQSFFEKWKQFYTDGGELYSLNSRSGIEKAVSNLGGNVIKSSPNVILGNVLEATIKLPTLYPKTFLPALGKVLSEGGLKKIPELERKGVYGVSYAGESLGKWEGLIGLTDVPFKNLLYYAGELERSGGGLKAVQAGAFTPRFGDLPSVYYGTGGRSAVQFLGYTINTYKMYGQMWKYLADPSTRGKGLQQLLTYHTMAALLGGGVAAGIPSVFEAIITSAFPDTEDWFAENKNQLATLVQPGNISKLGIGYDIASRQIQGVGKNWESAFEKFQYDDTLGGVLDLAQIGLNGLSFTNSTLGDLNIQKALKIGREVAEGEVDIEDLPGEAFEKYFPAMAKAE